jgi:hypothetical protein
LLASEYGWAKDYIFYNVYFDELFYFQKEIKKRRMNEYQMQLAIVQNPHVEKPEILWKMLNEQDDGLPRSEALDKEGLDNLKSLLAKGSNIVVK